MYNIKTLQKGWLTAASVTALTLGGPSWALPVRDDVGVAGAVDVNNVWAGVGQMFNRTSGFCTGQLINARTVITAAHCVDGIEASAYGGALGGVPIAFGFAPVANREAHMQWRSRGLNNRDWSSDPEALFYNGLQIQSPFDLVSEFTFPGADVALVTLDTPAIGLPTYGMLFSPILENTPVSMVGYGGHGLGLGSNLGIDNKRRTGANMLDGLFTRSQFQEAVFAVPNLDLGGFSNNIPLYHVDFDRPDRDPDDCSRTSSDDLFPNDIVCETPPLTFTYYDRTDVYSTTLVLGNHIDWFPGDAVEGEAGTLGGDSGGGLFVNMGGQDLVIGVLSGGWLSGMFQPSETLYGDISYYAALFQFQNWIVEQDPMIYASVAVGDGVWSNASRWTRELSPGYYHVDDNGVLQNGLWSDAPKTLQEPFDPDGPSFGTIFDTKVEDLPSRKSGTSGETGGPVLKV